MAAPSSIRIFGRPWAVRFKPRASIGGNLGLCEGDTQTLSIATLQSRFDTRDTVLHEALHALLMDAPFERPPEQEEQYVLFLSTRLLGVLRDNPALTQWLTEPP